MKYISFAIPCYNSQDYMAHAIESILPGGEDIEIKSPLRSTTICRTS